MLKLTAYTVKHVIIPWDFSFQSVKSRGHWKLLRNLRPFRRFRKFLMWSIHAYISFYVVVLSTACLIYENWLIKTILHNLFQVLVPCGELPKLQYCIQRSHCTWSCPPSCLYCFNWDCCCSQAGCNFSSCENHSGFAGSTILCIFQIVGSLHLQKLPLPRLWSCFSLMLV